MSRIGAGKVWRVRTGDSAMTDTRYDDTGYSVGPAGNFKQPALGFESQVARWVKMFEEMFVRWNNRRAIYKLSLLDNRQLRDIGVTRADVIWALSLPRSVDPSLELNDLVQRRRDASRWARTRASI